MRTNNRRIAYLFTLLCFLLATSASAQTGSIVGTVVDMGKDETLVGASVIIEGTFKGTITDFDGKFKLENLEPGIYSVQASFISYKPTILDGIRVEANKTTTVSIELEEITTELEGVTVTATRKTSTNLAMISSIKASLMVATGISAQQINNSQDKDASDVIRRVPGASIIDDRFVVVRGLNQRYNSVWINNASTPSSETDQKAFSFDVIPSAMIDNMMVSKSMSPELPADFTGGFIKIFTKNMPESNFMSISYTTGYNTRAHYGDFQLITTGKTDWLGVDGGTRNLPSGFPNSLKGYPDAELADLGKRLNTSWAPKGVSAFPEQKLNFSFGRKIQKGNRLLGNITSISYSHTYSSDELVNKGYQVQLNPGEIPPYSYNYTDSTYSRSVRLGILHNWSLFPGKGTKIEFRNLFNLMGNNTAVIRNGLNGYEGYTIRSYQDKYMSRITYSGQLGGEHKLGSNSDNTLDWVLGFAYSGRNEPDLKQLRTTLQSEPLLPHYNEYYASVGLTPSVSDAGRLFMNLHEYIATAGTNYEAKIKIGSWKPVIKTGLYSEYKNRTFDARILGFAKNVSYTESVWLPVETIFSLENINTTPSGFILKEMTSRSDSYDATNLLLAGYLTINTNITQKLRFYGGARFEMNNMRLNSYDMYNKPVDVKLDHIDIFPSANLTYNFNEKNLLRLAGGLSVNRPEFREIAPFYFYNFDEEADYVGNVNLKNAYVWNFDFRYELYPNAGEIISIGIFYKHFTSSIESVFRPAGNRLTFTYDNADNAQSAGAEVELRKSLEFIPLLKDFSAVLNASYIYSRVNFPANSIFRDRPMQGQSPYLVNAAVFYSNTKHKLNLSLQYNLIGDRIIAVGLPFQNSNQDIPDITEKHSHLVDFTASKGIGSKMEIKAGIKNLLNQKSIKYQAFKQADGGDLNLSSREMQPGITFSLGFSLNF